jgi:outer membrane protein TolC
VSQYGCIGDARDDRRAARSANTGSGADRHAYDLSLALYQQGNSSLIDALTEQRLLFTAQQSLVSTQLTARPSLINLYKALGGGWDKTQKQSTL